MNKITSLQRKDANILIAGCMGVLVTFVIGWMSLIILNFNPLYYIEDERIIEILLILPSMLLIFIIHEFVHIGFYLLFGKGRAKIKVVRDRSIGAVMMHQVNEDVFYTRTQMIIILLAPLVLLSVVILGLHSLVSAPFLIWVNIVLNALGSSVDIYVSWRLLKIGKAPLIVNFNSYEVVLNIYNKATH